ncbi:MAG: L-ribulose-5-phosphate 3-epimerase [Lachnospiraceae bacterium]
MRKALQDEIEAGHRKHPYTLGLYEKAMPSDLNWCEKLTIAKKIGYDFLEISIDESDEKLARLEMSKAERLELVEIMYKVGIPIRTMCLSGHRKYPMGSSDLAICDKGMEIMRQAIQLADDLGIRIIQLAGYDVYYEKSSKKTKKRFCENLKKATMLAAERGVLLAFETMETEFMNTVEKAMYYVGKIKSAYLQVYPDSGNLKNASLLYGTDMYLDLEKGKGHIAAMHLKETIPEKYREIKFGTGHVDFEKTIDCAWKMGVRRYVTELWYTGNEEWETEIKNAYDMMEKILEEREC